jgi:hypothetical protein
MARACVACDRGKIPNPRALAAVGWRALDFVAALRQDVAEGRLTEPVARAQHALVVLLDREDPEAPAGWPRAVADAYRLVRDVRGALSAFGRGEAGRVGGDLAGLSAYLDRLDRAARRPTAAGTPALATTLAILAPSPRGRELVRFLAAQPGRRATWREIVAALDGIAAADPLFHSCVSTNRRRYYDARRRLDEGDAPLRLKADGTGAVVLFDDGQA